LRDSTKIQHAVDLHDAIKTHCDSILTDTADWPVTFIKLNQTSTNWLHRFPPNRHFTSWQHVLAPLSDVMTFIQKEKGMPHFSLQQIVTDPYDLLQFCTVFERLRYPGASYKRIRTHARSSSALLQGLAIHPALCILWSRIPLQNFTVHENDYLKAVKDALDTLQPQFVDSNTRNQNIVPTANTP